MIAYIFKSTNEAMVCKTRANKSQWTDEGERQIMNRRRREGRSNDRRGVVKGIMSVIPQHHGNLWTKWGRISPSEWSKRRSSSKSISSSNIIGKPFNHCEFTANWCAPLVPTFALFCSKGVQFNTPSRICATLPNIPKGVLVAASWCIMYPTI